MHLVVQLVAAFLLHVLDTRINVLYATWFQVMAYNYYIIGFVLF